MTATAGAAGAVSFSDWLGLAYEQRHAVAAQWVESQQTDGSDGDGLLTEDASLALWALGQQLQHGDNTEEKPNFWEVYASAKWSAYESLRGTSRLDAMRKFISILDEDLGPRWPLEHASDLVAAAVAGGDPTELCSAAPTPPPSAASVTQAVAPADVSQSQEVGAPAVATASAVVSSGKEMWRVLAAGSDGPRPPPRCHHTTTLVGRRLLLMGGSGTHGVNHKLIHGWA